ncbi:hypothetical protein [Roseicella sp. DB1501]|uniref:hypothetical protein n=1 Tax=Roseicella sp. DB1501 TaxID=2730925 RepID=UPI001490928B|nr:hypothetical protein [Roseicella sp. DB1501]
MLLESHEERRSVNARVFQVLEAAAVYAVFYDGQPCNIRIATAYRDYPGPKYPRVTFMSPGHAHRMARRLNKRFNTTAFTVVRFVDGELDLGD